MYSPGQVTIWYKVKLPPLSFPEERAVRIASATEAFYGTKRFSEWLQRFLKSMLWPTSARAMALPVKESAHSIAGFVLASGWTISLQPGPCFLPHR